MRHIFLLALLATPAWADLPAAERFALVIGNNAPGPDQAALRFAEADANAVADVLKTLGGHDSGRVTVLETPTRDQAVAALETLNRRVARAPGKTVVTFYYSGHARAEGLDFGADPLSLDELRERLEAIPATVTLVVLDACRAGAFSQTKGAEPVEDFSVSSIKRLSAEGMVVLASSSAGELSQESEALGGSFFTHHLLVGLRGAADRDEDGRVGLSEAYDYAYHQTLLSTARTAVGRQHVTFESRLQGQGDLTLTEPATLPTHLVLGDDLRGDLVISSLRGAVPVVIAEINKVEGSRLRLSVAPGRYVGVLRQGERFYRCPVVAVPGGPTPLKMDACERDIQLAAAAKGVHASRTFDADEGWFIELAGGAGGGRSSAYTDRLDDFGYEEQAFAPAGSFLRGQALVGKRITRHFAVLGGTHHLGNGEYRLHEFEAPDRVFEFGAMAIPLLARAQYDWWDNLLVPYVQGGAGLGLARQKLDGADAEVEVGYVLMGGAGLQVNPWDHFGFHTEVDLTYAPILENRIGDTHDHGGIAVLFGLRGML